MFFVTKPRTYIAFCMLRALYWRYHVLRPSSIPSYPIASHHINPQEIHPITFHHVTHQVTWHDATVHHLTRHHFTWRWRHFTWRHMTWHDISQPITVLHLTSRRNQPHYFISPRSQPTSFYITSQHTTSPQPTRHENATSHHQNTTTRRNGWNLARPKTRFGQLTGWWPCAKFFSPRNFRPWLAQELWYNNNW